MQVTVNIKGLREAADKLAHVVSVFPEAVDKITYSVAKVVQETARREIRPQIGSTGRLAQSILALPVRLGDANVAYSVQSSLVYSKIQNYGGTIRANGNHGGDGVWLRFQSPRGSGNWIRTHSVTLPAKHYMTKGSVAGQSIAGTIATQVFSEVFA